MYVNITGWSSQIADKGGIVMSPNNPSNYENDYEQVTGTLIDDLIRQ